MKLSCVSGQQHVRWSTRRCAGSLTGEGEGGAVAGAEQQGDACMQTKGQGWRLSSMQTFRRWVLSTSRGDGGTGVTSAAGRGPALARQVQGGAAGQTSSHAEYAQAQQKGGCAFSGQLLSMDRTCGWAASCCAVLLLRSSGYSFRSSPIVAVVERAGTQSRCRLPHALPAGARRAASCASASMCALITSSPAAAELTS
jgi:hypothetical protein